MIETKSETLLGKLIWVGAPFASVFLLTGPVTDPVNITKLVATGALGGALLLVFLGFGIQDSWKVSRLPIISVIVFNLASLNASINSSSPFLQNLFGTYGRNTGFIAYLALTCIYVGSLMLRSTKSFQRLIQGLIIAGVLNLTYCSYVLLFGDFINWQNPYGSILGLFGNPDFISAFLGIFATTCLTFVMRPGQANWIRLLGIIAFAVSVMEIKKSHAIQGLVVTVAGIALIGYFLVRSKFEKRIIETFYAIVVTAIGVLAIFGTLQKGPFSFVYKRSVSLRGTYWRAGLKMGMDHPFTGVGMDAYGDWYRRARPPIALIDTPGINTTSNASHNVVIDFFAFGGWPLLVAYLALLLFAVISIVKIMRRNRKYDATFVALTSAWACYELQSIISINQIGLALWGWLLSGALVAYEVATRENSFVTEPKSKKPVRIHKQNQVISPTLLAGVGAIIGILVTASPFNADAKFKSALDSRNLNNVENSLTPTFYNFSDSYRFGIAVQTLYNSHFPDLALKYARLGVKFNSENFSAWQQLYSLPNSTEAEKKEAKQNLQRLDPLNPDVTKQ